MKKEFLPYELALEMKELGFDEVTICVFNRDRALKSNITSNPFGDRIEKDIHDERLSAPLFQQAFRWFREKYNLHPLRTGNEFYTSYSLNMKHLSFERVEKNKNHSEQAELECLKQLIKIAKNEPK